MYPATEDTDSNLLAEGPGSPTKSRGYLGARDVLRLELVNDMFISTIFMILMVYPQFHGGMVDEKLASGQ